IWVTDRYGKSAPKVSKVKIVNYGIGFHFEGLVSDANYFKEVSYNNTHPIMAAALAQQSVIHDVDGSLLRHKKEPTRQKVKMHGNHGGHAGHMARIHNQKPTGYIIYPGSSFLRHSKSGIIAASENLFYSKRENTGTLTIATGMGLTDPVHEHEGVFNGMGVYPKTGTPKYLKGKSNKYSLEVIADEMYTLDFGSPGISFFDFGFEWEAPSKKSIYLKIPYPHNRPVAMRSFGNQLFSVKDYPSLKKSPLSAFYWDKQNQEVTLKMVAQDNFEEMVIYSSDILTEITIDGEHVPLKMRSTKEKDRLLFEYEVPKANSYSKFEVLDYYGNVVEKPFEGTVQGSKNILEIALDRYDFKTKVYRFALTVGNQVHRGPIHPY
ncbi:MAG: hypothetical protein AAGC45_14630, partial [Bacteroidota bacterium]